MASYTPPPKNNIPFTFTTGGYQAPDFNNISANFSTGAIKSQMANLGAAIKGLQNYQHETFTFLKYCEQYIIGYSQHGVQIIKGKCHYGGIRDLGADIGGHYPVDLPAFLRGVVYADLPAEILPELGTQGKDLPAIIGGHLPENLGAIISAHLPRDLSAYIRGFAFKDLGALITSIYEQNLPGYIFGVGPKDLPAYLKVWPQEDLSAFIHGWQTVDLPAYLNATYYRNLSAYIATHSPRNLRGIIKGWVREATYDLGANVFSYAVHNLPAFIRATEMAQLPAYLFAIRPRNITAFIHGWQEADLPASIHGLPYPWNLPAYINVTGGYRNLSAKLVAAASTKIPRDLTAYILATKGRNDLPALLHTTYAKDLSAYLDTGRDVGDLPASIYPKKIRLTGILSVVTMAHKDLSATISIPCFYSDFRDLTTYVRAVHMADLGASIRPKDYAWSTKNLGALFGYTLNTVVQDKLSISVHVKALGFRTENKVSISLQIFRASLGLSASIIGEIKPVDLSAYINGIYIEPYDFKNWKSKERVFDRTYSQVVKDYEDIDISFQTIVKDYFYSSGSDVVAKVDKYNHFVTKVASYFSPAKSRLLDRRLNKVKYLYDMRHFATIDEAMRYAIWYVTTSPSADLTAAINSIAPMGYSDISARIGATRYTSDHNNLTSNINGKTTHDYDVVVGYKNDGVDYLVF